MLISPTSSPTNVTDNRQWQASPELSLHVVAGPHVDFDLLPQKDFLSLQEDSRFANAVLQSVARNRTISYIERGILPKEALRQKIEPDYFDLRSFHLVVTRGNYCLGSIRCGFHPIDLPDEYPTVFRQFLYRSSLETQWESSLMQAIRTIAPHSSTFWEISGWQMNPDFRRSSSVAILLTAFAMSLAVHLKCQTGVCTVRTSSAAYKSLRRFLNAQPIQEEETTITVNDPFYKDQFHFLTMHYSQRNLKLQPSIDRCLKAIREQGLTGFSDGRGNLGFA